MHAVSNHIMFSLFVHLLSIPENVVFVLANICVSSKLGERPALLELFIYSVMYLIFEIKLIAI